MTNLLETYNAGVALTTTEVLSDLPNGYYRVVSGGATVTIATSIDNVTFNDIGTATSGTSKDVYISRDMYFKATFTGTATLQRMRGLS